ncbi:hypothetical protein FBY26_2211 [Phycicoccus sp. SLBN-51]|nr:hypothetical protein FBY26_2211 [Phycicoccus sp. SLBN-51]
MAPTREEKRAWSRAFPSEGMAPWQPIAVPVVDHDEVRVLRVMPAAVGRGMRAMLAYRPRALRRNAAVRAFVHHLAQRDREAFLGSVDLDDLINELEVETAQLPDVEVVPTDTMPLASAPTTSAITTNAPPALSVPAITGATA